MLLKWMVVSKSVSVMRKIILLIPLVLLGQGTQTTYQNLFTNATTTPLVSGAVRNIGQSNHLAVLILADAPAHTCSAPIAGTALNFRLQGSFDRTNSATFADIPSKFRIISGDGTVQTATRRFTAYVIGTGAFPVVRVVLGTFDNTNCIASIFYSSTIPPQNSFDLGLGPNNNNVTSGDIQATPFDYNGIVTNSNLCGPLSGLRSSVYGLVFSNATVANTITFTDGIGSTLGNIDLPVGAYGVWPFNGTPYLTSRFGNGVTVTTTAAGNHFKGFVICRWE